MSDLENRNVEELHMDELDQAAGGYVVKDPKTGKYMIVRQDGSVIAPAPDQATAERFARQFNTSARTLTADEYKKLFGRELNW